MNIAIFTRNLVGYGGIPYSLKYLSIGWKKQGLYNWNNLDIIILENIDKRLLKEIRENHVNIICLNNFSRFKQFFRIFKVLRKNSYNYLLCTCFRTYLFVKILNPLEKVIIWFRGDDYLNSFFKRFFFNVTNNTTSFVNSQYTANIYNLKKYKVIYNGISKDFLYMYSSDFYDRFYIPNNSKVIGFIGGWCDLKNHITLIRAFNLVAEKYKNIYLVCIGEHSELTKEALKEVKYKNRVRFKDKMTYASRYLKYFDVYVQPSYKEGFGNAVVEAMYAGCPIVSCKAGALPELIENGINGILYSPPTDAVSCFHAIKILLNNKILASKLSNNSKKIADKCYSPEVFAKQFIGGLISLNQE